LDFSRYIGNGKPVRYKDTLIVGFDKRRKTEVETFEDEFIRVGLEAKNHQGHKILVLHQGISEINKFAGELNSTDLPSNFTYYAMGHLHDQELKRFTHLGGPLAYPGSIELTSSESIKETQKGFYQVDLSQSEASPRWVKIDTRPQLSVLTSIDLLEEEVNNISEKIKLYSRKPIVEFKIKENILEPEFVQAQISKLSDLTLHCFWKHISPLQESGSVFIERPLRIEDEIFRITKEILGSTEIANFAINELLPLLTKGNIDDANHAVNENFVQFKKRLKNAPLS
jgi:DNA repair exonuclease SbcCD nuclease subunit